MCTMTWMSRALQMFYPNVRTTIWPGGKIGNEFALKDTPKCGFDGELCATGGGMSDVISNITQST